jgi:heme o synthase
MRFLSVVKPGIIFGNIVTVCGGFFLGSEAAIDFPLLLITMIGMALVIGSGCVFNNYIDRDIDRLMERTKNRVLVKGLIVPRVALIYATVLGVAGFIVLDLEVNTLTAFLAGIGFFVYVVVYSLGLKRKSTYGTTIGGIAGAIPPVVGYAAVTDRFDTGAVLLFLILFFWQMPHFYAISIYRLQDFSAAALPILPLKKNIHYTKISMLVYTLLFAIVAVLPSFFGYTGLIYLVTALCLSLIWLGMGLQGFSSKTNHQTWARRMFFFSIINITVLCLMMAVKT